MTQPEKILVIMLSITLFLLLILCILVAIKTLQILKRVKAITEKTEDLANKAESIGNIMQKSAATMAFTRVITNITENALRAMSIKNNSKNRRNEK